MGERNPAGGSSSVREASQGRSSTASGKLEVAHVSVEEQIARLRPSLCFAPQMHLWLLVVAALGVVFAAVFWHPVPLMFAAFFGIVAWSEQQAGPNIQRAILAYDAGTPAPGEITIQIAAGDSGNTYRAIVHEPGHEDWEYAFIPQGWQPIAGRHAARIWRAEGNHRPLLAVVAEGILIPRYDPVQPAVLSCEQEP